MSDTRNVANKMIKKVLLAISIFYSRIILRKLKYDELTIYRKIEKLMKICTKINADIKYLNFCEKNQLLPKFVNFKLYDVTAQYEKSTVKFKIQLLQREICNKKCDLSTKLIAAGKQLVILRNNTRGLHFYAAVFHLKRILQQYESDVTITHTNKLKKLYGGDIYLAENKLNVINLSTYILTDTESNLLNKGLNFAIPKKQNVLNRKIEMERLYFDINKHKQQNNISVKDNDDFKTKLKNFSIQSHPDNAKQNLNNEEQAAIKTLQSNKDIVIKRPDKGGGVVVLDKTYYNNSLLSLIQDTNKFIECDKNQSSNVKKEINVIAAPYKEGNESIYKVLHRRGDYNNGHLYGLPKIHKNKQKPPLRPIISMTGTVTHDIAQYLNNLIRPYINKNNMIQSSNELLVHLQHRTVDNEQVMCSLDVESLFTNVPVDTTINIIAQSVYHSEHLPPPPIPETTLRDLLRLCTTCTPFNFMNKTYLQRDGVSMGSPLGPTFADFYMSALENHVLSQDKVSNPLFYVRYVDDILAIFNSKRHINYFIRRLSNNSILKFTSEIMENNEFHFLDVKITVRNSKIFTGVFIKETDKGTYAHYDSHTLLNYKISVIKYLVRRAVKYCDSWFAINQEINRLKQIFVNNRYPLTVVDKTINKTLTSIFSNTDSDIESNDLQFFVALNNVSTFKSDQKSLKNIINTHVTGNNNITVKIKPYYKPFKISSLFSTRPKTAVEERTNVVYEFVCSEDSCNASYVGYTTCTLLNRCKNHRYSQSSIYKHFAFDHNMSPPIISDLIKNFKILYSDNNDINLRIAEAITIKRNSPIINVKYNEFYNVLNLFK